MNTATVATDEVYTANENSSSYDEEFRTHTNSVLKGFAHGMICPQHSHLPPQKAKDNNDGKQPKSSKSKTDLSHYQRFEQGFVNQVNIKSVVKISMFA